MINSITWQEWLTVYLVVGAVVTTVLYFFRGSKKPTFTSQIATAIEKQLDNGKPLTQRILERRIVPGLALVFSCLVWPAMLVARLWVFYRHSHEGDSPMGLPLQAQLSEDGTEQRLENDLFVSPHQRIILAKERLTRMSIADIERANMIDDPLGAVPAVPFGHLNPAWKYLKDQQKSGEEFWGFRCERVGLEKQFTAFSGYALFDGETYVGHVVIDYELPR